MKSTMKFFAVATILVCFTAVSYAQPRAIGGRLGYGVEFSYEHGLGDNMLSVDAGFPGLFLNNTIGAEAAVTYDWINPFGASFASVWDGKGEWNWYMGVGGAVGGYFYHYPNTSYWNNTLFAGIAGRIGVEYNFWFPLQLSVDWRPVLGPEFSVGTVYGDGGSVSSDTDVRFHTSGLWAGSICLAVRYRF